MDWMAALRARLVAVAPGERAYMTLRPQHSPLPALTLQTVSEDRPQHMTGFQGLPSARVQVDSWAATYEEARSNAEAAIAALVPEHEGNGWKFARGFVETIRDMADPTSTDPVRRVSVDMIIHYEPA